MPSRRRRRNANRRLAGVAARRAEAAANDRKSISLGWIDYLELRQKVVGKILDLETPFDADEHRPLEIQERPRFSLLASPIDCAFEIALSKKTQLRHGRARAID